MSVQEEVHFLGIKLKFLRTKKINFQFTKICKIHAFRGNPRRQDALPHPSNRETFLGLKIISQNDLPLRNVGIQVTWPSGSWLFLHIVQEPKRMPGFRKSIQTRFLLWCDNILFNRLPFSLQAMPQKRLLNVPVEIGATFFFFF